MRLRRPPARDCDSAPRSIDASPTASHFMVGCSCRYDEHGNAHPEHALPGGGTIPSAIPDSRRSLADFVRRRVPSADVDDVVQTVLVEALAAPGRPTDASELRRWVLGIARHKVVDFHRRATREPPMELPDIEASPPPIEERALARWAEEAGGLGG